MNRINQLFNEKQGNIISAYFCAGHPTLDSTMPILRALQDGGIDMAEIGIPFSDPIADGPIVQSATAVSLNNGMSLRRLFNQLKDVRKEITMPLMLTGYFNVIYKFGFEAFCQQCRECGIDGVIIPDMPFELYLNSFKEIAGRHDIRVIMLITPESAEERIRQIDSNTDGFLRLVSTETATGAGNTFSPSSTDFFKRIRGMNLKNPALVGFGISNKATLETSCQYAKGGIVDSTLVTMLQEGKSPAEAVAALASALGQ